MAASRVLYQPLILDTPREIEIRMADSGPTIARPQGWYNPNIRSRYEVFLQEFLTPIFKQERMVKIPSRIEDLFPAAAVEKILDVLQQPDLSGKLRETLDKVGLREINPLEQVQQAWQQARSWIQSLVDDDQSAADSNVVNATGQLLREDFANVPVCSSVAQVYANAAAKFLQRERVQSRAIRAARHAFPNHSTCWTSGPFTASQALLDGRQVLIAKTDLVRIQGIGDVSALLQGISVVEVGPSNGCEQHDWQEAIQTAQVRDESNRQTTGQSSARTSICILVVSPNNLSAEVSQQQMHQAIAAAQAADIPIFGLLADGVVNKTLAEEYRFPLLHSHLDAGLDASICPLHLLLGGTEGALIVGKEEFVAPAAQWSRLRGTNLPFAALSAAVVALQLGMVDEGLNTGVLGNLLANPLNLEDRARRLATQLSGNGRVISALAVSRSVPLGPTPWSRYILENWAVEIQTGASSEETRAQLLAGQSEQEHRLLPPIAASIEAGKLLIDLRFVDPKDDHLVVMALSPASSEADSSGDRTVADPKAGTAGQDASGSEGVPPKQEH